MNYLAIDLGAESGRVMLGSIEREKITLREIHRFPNTPIRTDTSLRWNLRALLDEIHRGLKAASAVKIESLSVDSWGVDYVLLDSKDELMEPTFHYRDPRTKTGTEKFLPKVPWAKIFEETGIQYMPINTLFQLAAESPQRLTGAGCLLGVADAFNSFLGGARHNEESLASTFQIYDPRKRDWSELLLRELNLRREALAPIVRPGSVIGESSLVPGAKVVATCSHDTGAAVAAVPATGRNWAYLSSGTWSLMGVERSSPIINDKARDLNFTNEIGYGSTIRLLKNISGLWLLQECRRAWADGRQNFDYAELTRLAESEKSERALIDPMDGRFLAPPNMPEAIAGFCREHGLPEPKTPGQFTRCIFESLAQLYAKTLRQLEELTEEKIERLHIVGGGSKNALLNQLTANACKISVLAGPVEATALGNILIQAITAGEIADLASGRALIQKNFPVTTFTPQLEA